MEKLSRMSMANDYFKSMDAYSEYQSTEEGNRMGKLLEALNKIAFQFSELHDITCCTRIFVKHSHYQCKHNSDPIIAWRIFGAASGRAESGNPCSLRPSGSPC